MNFVLYSTSNSVQKNSGGICSIQQVLFQNHLAAKFLKINKVPRKITHGQKLAAVCFTLFSHSIIDACKTYWTPYSAHYICRTLHMLLCGMRCILGKSSRNVSSAFSFRIIICRLMHSKPTRHTTGCIQHTTHYSHKN